MLRIAATLLVLLVAEGGSRMTGAPSTAASGLLLVANKGDHTLGIIDPAAGRQVAAVEEKLSKSLRQRKIEEECHGDCEPGALPAELAARSMDGDVR